MARGVIVIESAESPLRTLDIPLPGGRPNARCTRMAWSDLGPERLADGQAELVVAVAVPEPPGAVRLLRWLAEHRARAATFAVLRRECGVELLRAAAQVVDDFVLWPAPDEEIRQRISRILAAPDAAEDHLAESLAVAQMVGRAPVFLEVVRKLPRVAAAGVPVLLTGETGTGKELCARALHFLSRRRPAPFVPVDCAALPDVLFESEVFGHARGAFTDAHCEQRGLVAMAEGGTLLLDEVDTLSAGVQAKLLRFLEEGTYRPLGADHFARADVHVISATNLDLERQVREGRFRSDLFFRLAGLQLRLPPLRERPGDIRLLADYFVALHQPRDGTPPRVLSEGALQALQAYTWPGNVRELANVIRSAVALSVRRQVLPEDLALPVSPAAAPGTLYRHLRASVVTSFERRYLEDLFRRHQGNVTHASREAGQDRRALGRLARKHAIDPRTFHLR